MAGALEPASSPAPAARSPANTTPNSPPSNQSEVPVCLRPIPPRDYVVDHPIEAARSPAVGQVAPSAPPALSSFSSGYVAAAVNSKPLTRNSSKPPGCPFAFNQIVRLSDDWRLWCIIMSPQMHAEWLEWKAQYRLNSSSKKKKIPREKSYIPIVVNSPSEVATYERNFGEWLKRTKPTKAHCCGSNGIYDINYERSFRMLYASLRAEHGSHKEVIRVSMALPQTEQEQQAARLQAKESPGNSTDHPSTSSSPSTLSAASSPAQKSVSTQGTTKSNDLAMKRTMQIASNGSVSAPTGTAAAAVTAVSCCPCASKWLEGIQSQFGESIERLANMESQLRQLQQEQQQQEQTQQQREPLDSLLQTLLQRVDELEQEKEFLYQRLDWERNWRKRAEARLQHLEAVNDVEVASVAASCQSLQP